jgi:hypothetical protein
MTDDGGAIIQVRTSLYQADPEIAALALSNSVDGIISGGDSDIALYIGASRASAAATMNEEGAVGADFMLVRAPKISMRHSSVESFTIVTGQSRVKESCTNGFQGWFKELANSTL